MKMNSLKIKKLHLANLQKRRFLTIVKNLLTKLIFKNDKYLTEPCK